jgi:TonB-linked SusC/RagA family outer membrane protein
MTRWSRLPTGRCAAPGLPRRFAVDRLLYLLATVVLLSANAQLALAQTGEISGTVSASGSGEPIAGAQVVVAGTTQGATTDDRGRFRLGGVAGTNVMLEVRRIGYRLERVSARVGQTNVGISLTVNPASLDAVVVTGTAGATQKRELGNAIGQINASEVVAAAPIMSMQSLLNGRTPGVVIMPTSGQVGTGSQVRVRGQASLSLGNNPLLYVDGVRVNNASSTGPVSQAFGSSPISRLNDFNPEDIESIEVLKGPSAATLYGTEAANGVINIITKKGASGTPRWNVIWRQGVNYFDDWKNRFPTNYGRRRLPTDGSAATGPYEALDFDSLLVGNCGSAAATAAGKKCDIWRNGRHQETELSVTGGAGLFTYYASGNLFDSEGAEPRNNRRTYSGRLNVGFAPAERFRISTNIGYTAGPTNIPCDAGCGGYTWTTLSATPNNYNLANRHGFHSSIPYQYDQTVVLWQDLRRTTASVQFEHNPRSWFTHRLVLGGDVTNEGNNEWDPRIDSLQSQGFRSIEERTVTNRSLDYSANGIWNALPNIRLTTSAGAQYFTESVHAVAASGSIFPTPGLKSVSSTTNRNAPSEGFVDDKVLGVYGQEQLAWRDRLFLTAALRSDDHSAFGAGFNRVTYPKLSVSWVLSDEPWFTIPFVSSRLDQLRFRAAYGESGKAPNAYSSIRTYSPSAGPGDAPAVIPNTTGNPDLGPERGKELEVGFDASAMQDRIGLEFTYYNKKTTDAILEQTVAPSSGQSGTRPVNIGGVVNRGIELMLRGSPMRGERLGLDVTASVSTNDNEVTELGIPGRYFVSAGTFLRHQIGYPIFAWFEQRVVETGFNRTTGVASNVMCADTLPGGREAPRDATHPARLCAGANGIYGDSDDAPEVYLGRSVPPTELSFTGTLTFFKRFHVFSMVDVKNGHKKLDGNTRVRCGIFGRCKENFANDPASGFAAEVDSIRTAQAQSNSNLVDFLVAPSNFARWRELTVSYDIPERYTRAVGSTRARVSVSGRNLKLWTNYQGFEPEAMFLGGSRGGNAAWEQTTLPQLQSWMVTFNLGF